MSHTPRKYFLSKNRFVKTQKYLGAPQLPTHQAGPQHCNFPLIPFMPWGLHFDLDLMAALKNSPPWGMLEVSKIYGPDGQHVWFTLDSLLTGTQFVGLPDQIDPWVSSMLQAFPSKQYASHLKVIEERIGNRAYFCARYMRYNLQTGEQDPVAFELELKLKKFGDHFDVADKPPFTRNGNAMNHSHDVTMAMLDLNSINLTQRARLIEGTKGRVDSILGIKIAALMSQATGGAMVFDGSLSSDGIFSETKMPIHQWSWDSDSAILRTTNSYPSFEWHFDKHDSFYFLRKVCCFQKRVCLRQGVMAPWNQLVWEMIFNTALPDLRFQVSQQSVSKFCMNINGREGYATGEVIVRPSNDSKNKTNIEINPTRPHWAAARPMRTVINFDRAQDIRFKSNLK